MNHYTHYQARKSRPKVNKLDMRLTDSQKQQFYKLIANYKGLMNVRKVSEEKKLQIYKKVTKTT